MSAAVLNPPAKRVLEDTSNARRNTLPPTPSSAKKRKLNHSSPAKYNKATNALGSSQPKSKFEEEVLEKLTQDISGLKKNNSEKDQQWARPPLSNFEPETDNLCFQQIEAEEGTLHGGSTTVRLFGVTQV